MMKKYSSKIRLILIVFSLIFFLLGLKTGSYNFQLVGIILIWIYNLYFALLDIGRRMFFLVFVISQFVFFLYRPIAKIILGIAWNYTYLEMLTITLQVLYLSFFLMMLGAELYEHLQNKKKKSVKLEGRLIRYENTYIKEIRNISLLGFVFTWGCNMLVGIEKVIFMRGREYKDYYTMFESKLPYIIIVLGAMMVYFLCVYLATRPKKRDSFIVLFMYIVSAIPLLIVGARNAIVLNCLFALLYYGIRDGEAKGQKWLDKFEKTFILVGSPFVLVFLGIYAKIRMDAKIHLMDFIQGIGDFFYGQGVTFDVLVYGFGAMPYLPKRSLQNYTFGGFIDYFTRGSFAQKFFGAKPLGNGNDLVNALESNNFAHNMSYIAAGADSYLDGFGFGSSYILETYADWGYIGVAVFSFLLGMVLLAGKKWTKRSLLLFTIVLVALGNVFLAPRAEALGWLQFIAYAQFWLPIVACYVGAPILRWITVKLRKLVK